MLFVVCGVLCVVCWFVLLGCDWCVLLISVCLMWVCGVLFCVCSFVVFVLLRLLRVVCDVVVCCDCVRYGGCCLMWIGVMVSGGCMLSVVWCVVC